MQGLGPPESGWMQKICALVESGSVPLIITDSDTQLDF